MVLSRPDGRGDGLQCPVCEHQTTYACPECGAEVRARQHIAANFLIGAHAEVNDALLSFDTGFYRGHFDAECLSIQSE